MNSKVWPKVRLGEISLLITKGTTPTTLGYEFVEQGINFVKSESITFDGQIDMTKFAFIDETTHQALSRSILSEGDVLFSMAGVFLGKTAIVPKSILPANTNQAVGIIRLDCTKAEPRFIDYYLRNKSYNNFINNLVAQSAQPNINLAEIKNLPIILPSLPEQRAIAHTLGTLDDKIELNRGMNETLEAMARAIFKSWFVDFDPVRAKAEGRQPAGVDAETAALFPDSFEDSAIGKIPKGWTAARLSEVARVNERSITKDYHFKVIEYIDISSVNAGRLENTTAYSIEEAPSRAKRLVKHGDTIWSTVRPNRKSYLFIHSPRENLVVSTGFAVLTPCSIPSSYLYAWVTTEEFVDYLAYNADGSAYPAVLPGRFADALILLPPSSLLDEFERQAGVLRDRIANNERESHTLAALRDTLLPKLMSGEVRVATQDADQFIEAGARAV